jgi:hypothetical protein
MSDKGRLTSVNNWAGEKAVGDNERLHYVCPLHYVCYIMVGEIRRFLRRRKMCAFRGDSCH